MASAAGDRGAGSPTEAAQQAEPEVVREAPKDALRPGGKVPKTEFGKRIVRFEQDPGEWRTTYASAEGSTSVKGGISLQEEFTNMKTGERIVRHRLITREGNVVHQDYRTYLKE